MRRFQILTVLVSKALVCRADDKMGNKSFTAGFARRENGPTVDQRFGSSITRSPVKCSIVLFIAASYLRAVLSGVVPGSRKTTGSPRTPLGSLSHASRARVENQLLFDRIAFFSSAVLPQFGIHRRPRQEVETRRTKRSFVHRWSSYSPHYQCRSNWWHS